MTDADKIIAFTEAMSAAASQLPECDTPEGRKLLEEAYVAYAEVTNDTCKDALILRDANERTGY